MIWTINPLRVYKNYLVLLLEHNRMALESTQPVFLSLFLSYFFHAYLGMHT